MIEIHTKVFCKCGARYHHMFAQYLPFKEYELIYSECPICSNVNTIEYEFTKITSPKCCEEFSILDHFSLNEGNTNDEYYPRPCVCGKEILLKQRRV